MEWRRYLHPLTGHEEYSTLCIYFVSVSRFMKGGICIVPQYFCFLAPEIPYLSTERRPISNATPFPSNHIIEMVHVGLAVAPSLYTGTCV